MKYKIILLLVSLCMLMPAYAAETASQILDKAVSNINKKSNLSCSFSISGDGTALSGKLVSAKNKFQRDNCRKSYSSGSQRDQSLFISQQL